MSTHNMFLWRTTENYLIITQYSYPTSFGHICFKMLIAEEFSFIVSSLDVPVYSGVSKQHIFWKPLKFYF